MKAMSDNVHTPEIQAIITKVPSWIVRWGILIFTGILIMALSVSAVVRYPEMVKRPVRSLYTADLPRIMAQTAIAEADLNKIRVGQRVIIRLTVFNSDQYPPIKGKVIAIADRPDAKGLFAVSIKLEGLDPKISVKLKSWMTGTADIITRDVTVLQRVTNNLTEKVY